MPQTLFTKKYSDPRGPLYKKMSFSQRYETEIIFFSCVFMVALVFLVALASITPTIAGCV